MSFEFVTKLPTPEEIRLQYPITEKIARVKAQRDQEIKDIFTGKSDRFLVIIGPCSADNEDSVCDYVGRLAKVQDQVSDRLLLIPRIYTNKPRTTGEGYKGLLHQPDPEKKPDVLAGLVAIRKLHMRAIEETGLTAADEMLYPENWRYLSDILSYVAIGEPAAPSGGQRHGYPRRNEESHQWRPFRHVELRSCGTAWTYVHLP